MGLIAIALVIDIVVSVICLLVSVKKGWIEANIKDLLTIVGIVSVVSLIPRIGWPIGVVLFAVLLMVIVGMNFNQSVKVTAAIKSLSLTIFVGIALALS